MVMRRCAALSVLLAACAIDNPTFGVRPGDDGTSSPDVTAATTGAAPPTSGPDTTGSASEGATSTPLSASTGDDTTGGPGQDTDVPALTSGETGSTTSGDETGLDGSSGDASTGDPKDSAQLFADVRICYGTMPGSDIANVSSNQCFFEALAASGNSGELFVDLEAKTAQNFTTRWSSVLLFSAPEPVNDNAAAISEARLRLRASNQAQSVAESGAAATQSPGHVFPVDCGLVAVQFGEDTVEYFAEPKVPLDTAALVPEPAAEGLLSPGDVVVFDLDVMPLKKVFSEGAFLCLAVEPTHANGVVYQADQVPPTLELVF